MQHINNCPACGGAGKRRPEDVQFCDEPGCTAGAERAAVQKWAIEQTEARGFGNLTIWEIYQHGRASAARQAQEQAA